MLDPVELAAGLCPDESERQDQLAARRQAPSQRREEIEPPGPLVIDHVPDPVMDRRRGFWFVRELVEVNGRLTVRHKTVPIRRYAPDDVAILRPLFELGERYADSASRLVRLLAAARAQRSAVAAAAARAVAVAQVGAGERGRDVRKAVRALLATADELDALAEVIAQLAGWRNLSTAVAAAALAIDSAIPTADLGRIDTACDRVLELARGHGEFHGEFRRAGDQIALRAQCAAPWKYFALAGWRCGLDGHSWVVGWCAGKHFFSLLTYPDRSLGEAAGISAGAAKKHRLRSSAGRDPGSDTGQPD